MPKVWVRQKNDGRGPYRWCPIEAIPEGVALGNVYRQTPDQLSSEQLAELAPLYPGYDFHLGEKHPDLVAAEQSTEQAGSK